MANKSVNKVINRANSGSKKNSNMAFTKTETTKPMGKASISEISKPMGKATIAPLRTYAGKSGADNLSASAALKNQLSKKK